LTLSTDRDRLFVALLPGRQCALCLCPTQIFSNNAHAQSLETSLNTLETGSNFKSRVDARDV